MYPSEIVDENVYPQTPELKERFEYLRGLGFGLRRFPADRMMAYRRTGFTGFLVEGIRDMGRGVASRTFPGWAEVDKDSDIAVVYRCVEKPQTMSEIREGLLGYTFADIDLKTGAVAFNRRWRKGRLAWARTYPWVDVRLSGHVIKGGEAVEGAA